MSKLQAMKNDAPNAFRSLAAFIGRKFVKTLKRLVLVGAIAFVGFYFFVPGPIKIDEGTTLYVPIDKPMTEWSTFDGQPALYFMSNATTISSNLIRTMLRNAALDANIQKVVINLTGMDSTDFGPVTRLIEDIQTLKAAGKEVTAFAPSYNTPRYLVAMHADKVLMSEMGHFTVGSFSINNLYFRDVFDRYDVEVITGQAGRFKSAIETYTRRDMSDPSRANWEAVLQDQFDWATKAIATARGLNPNNLRISLIHWPDTVRQNSMSDVDMAMSLGLVDGTISAPDLVTLAYGSPAEADSNKYIDISKYYRVEQADRCEEALNESPDPDALIALVTMEGEIRPTGNRPGIISADTFVSQLEGLARLDNLSAVVLRLNTPGGDALASEIIRQELEALKAAGIPVVTSMGAVTASGGYWIASASDRIFAEPTTITGSIGAFSLRLSASTTLKTAGVTLDSLNVGRQLQPYSIFEPVREHEGEQLQYYTDQIYTKFIDVVSAGRDLAPNQVHEVAQGQIWTAAQALNHGLVDEIGSLEDAIKYSAEQANVPPSCTAYSLHPSTRANLLQAFMPKGMGPGLSSYIGHALAATPASQKGQVSFIADALQGKRKGVQVFCSDCSGIQE